MGYSTILDVLGATIIGGLLLLTLVRLNARSTENHITYGSDKILQKSSVQLAGLIEKDFRKIGYCADPTKISDTTSKVISGDISSISFLTDVDKDGNPDVIKYFLSDTTALSMTKNPRDRILFRQINSQTPLNVNSNIVQFIIKYYDVFNNELPAPVAKPSLVAHLEVSFKVEDSNISYKNKYVNKDDYNQAYWQQVRLSSRNIGKR